MSVPPTVRKVGLLVDDSDARIAEILGNCDLDLLQLHGHETPERVAEIRARFAVGRQVGQLAGKELHLNGPATLLRRHEPCVRVGRL